MKPAPLFDDVADGPDGGAAFWLTARDGVRIRIAVWPDGEKGTVLLFPGRTEYVEKYGRAARDLRTRGYATVTLDWRGQGLAERMLNAPEVGFVDDFMDYQLDVMALARALPALDLPSGPHFLLAHSMGGAIGLRALFEGLKVPAAAFTAPMWDIMMPTPMRAAARVLTTATRPTPLGRRFAPGTSGNRSYVDAAAFEGNDLTADAEMFAYMQRQVTDHPELTLGGPSLIWVHEAMREIGQLAHRPSPDIPALTFLGGEERIVSPDAIRQRMARWPGGRLIEVAGARHEVMMEGPDTRRMVFDEICALFDAAL